MSNYLLGKGKKHTPMLRFPLAPGSQTQTLTVAERAIQRKVSPVGTGDQ